MIIAEIERKTKTNMNGIDVSKWQPENITDLVDYDFCLVNH